MIFRKRKDAVAQESDPEVPLTEQEYAEEYDLIFNCAFDGPSRFASY